MSSRLKLLSAVVAGGAAAAIAIVGLANAQDTKPEAKPVTRVATTAPVKASTVQTATVNPVLLRKAEAPAAVDWAAAVKQSRLAPAITVNPAVQARQLQPLAARLPKAQIDKTRVPMLMPRTGGMLKTDQAKVVSFGDAYSLNLPQDKGMQITLMGNRSLIKADRGTISKKARTAVTGVAEVVRITRLEDGWTASFRRYGVLYTVDLLCDDLKSADCLSDAYLRRAVADLSEVTLGQDAQKEAQAAGVRQ